MPRLSLKTPARLLESARKDKSKGGRERFTLANGDSILCESRSERDWWEEFTEALRTKQIRPEDLSIRDIFCSVIPDGQSLCEAWRNNENVSLQEAAGAVTSAQFSNITGQIVYTATMDAYQSEDKVFSRTIPTQSTPFNGEKIPGITGLGDMAEVVEEGQPYPLTGVTEDWIETPQTKKRGNIVPITKEAIFFDRTNLILQRCAQVGEFLGVNREKRAIDCVIDENTTAHRHRWRNTVYASYQGSTPWVNLQGSNGLVDWTDVNAAEQLFAGLVDPDTGEPIMLGGVQLIVTPQLVHTARYILNATSVALQAGGFAVTGNLFQTQAPNPIGGGPLSGAYSVLTSRLLAQRMATDTSWFLGDIAKACVYMENFPLTTQTAPPNSEDEFNRDIVAKYKASERGAYFVRQPRAIVKSTQ